MQYINYNFCIFLRNCLKKIAVCIWKYMFYFGIFRAEDIVASNMDISTGHLILVSRLYRTQCTCCTVHSVHVV